MASNESVERRVGEQRPGGRAARVRSSVLHAATELLEEVGYDAVTFEDVATRAGVHRTTVYRRWPTKPELVADAVRVQSGERVPVPDTGALRSDLESLAAAVAANISSDGGARRSRSIVAATATSDQLAAVVHEFMSERVGLTEVIVARAIDRGEVPAGLDARTVIEALVAPIWFRLLVTGDAIDGAFLAATVDFVTTAARGGDAVPTTDG